MNGATVKEYKMLGRTGYESGAISYMLPTEDDLPYDDGDVMETERHKTQMELLIDSLKAYWKDSRKYYTGGNMFVHFEVNSTKHFKGPGTIIDTHEGTKRVAGMLLMTFGMTETVRLLHPREWIIFLNKEHYQPIVRKYADALLKHAKYKKCKKYSVGSLPQMPEISAFGKTMKECRQDMAETVSGRILLKIARREEAAEEVSEQRAALLAEKLKELGVRI